MSRARENADGARLDAPLASPTFTGTVAGVTGTHITTGTLGNTVQDNITRLGTVTAGTLGSGVTGGSGLDGVSAGIDRDVDSWYNIITTEIDYNSSAIIDFQTTALKTGVTESAGTVTVATAGWYFIYCNLNKPGSTDDAIQVYLRKNGETAGHRMHYGQASEINYLAVNSIWVIEASAGNTFEIWGYGDMYGDSGYNIMCYFGGFRLGD